VDDLKDCRMKARKPRYYRSLDEYFEQEPADAAGLDSNGEFPPEVLLPIEVPASGISRRRFMSLVSASAALALGTAACSRIDRGSIVPYTRRPEEVIPGVATYYASTFQEGLITHGVLVKTREGRPIHVEGNSEHPLSKGKTSLRSIADVLSLYDPDRLRKPSRDGTPSTWDEALRDIALALTQARDGSKPVLLLTGAVVSPSQRALIEDLKKALPALRHAAWEPAASQPALLAARALYGDAPLARPRFDRADVILSLQSDFLGIDGDASDQMRDFAARRSIAEPTDSMNRLWVVEGAMSLTGANADVRLQARPSKIAPLVFALARDLNESQGVPLPSGLNPDALKPFSLETLAKDLGLDPALLRSLAGDLRRAGKSSMVIAGPALPPEAHIAGHLVNAMLGAEGYTIDASSALPAPDLLTYAGLQDLLGEAARGAFAAAIFWDVNPAYAFPQASAWKSAAAEIPMKIRIGLYEDETALDCRWRLPAHHWLEAWGDFEPAADLLSLRQPAMGAIHDTRQGEDILLALLRAIGAEAPPAYHDYVKARWQKEVYEASNPVAFETFWNAALHDGVMRRAATPRSARVPRLEGFLEAVKAAAAGRVSPAELELILAPDAGVYDGRYANNGWLNELPNPVTKATWENPLLLSISDAGRFGLADEDVVKVSAGSESLEVPVLIQPGQTPGVASLALGYGRRTGSVAAGVGTNGYLLVESSSASPFLRGGIAIARTGKTGVVARTQMHFRMEGRDLVRSWTLAEYAQHASSQESKTEGRELISLIPAPQFAEHKWGMAIDLSSCVGCSACLIACQSENNIPVVGPERVHKSREMHWIRIDRYYEGDPKDPAVVHQPVPCQHCDDAPCEVVCPVNATTHSPDGLNQMAYNRCVGTRYCSNNCPFKVRRFNFFDYTSTITDPQRLVFNPEVTVRPRGVMEKCSFCIQRIEDVKLRSNVEGRAIRDGEIKPACAVACPAQAIVFGDLHDPQSKVSKMSKQNRGYRMLEELGIKPSVTYLTDISNPVAGKGKS